MFPRRGPHDRRHLRPFPRRRLLPDARRPARGRRAGRAFHADQARSVDPPRRLPLLPGGGGPHHRRRRRHRVLRGPGQEARPPALDGTPAGPARHAPVCLPPRSHAARARDQGDPRVRRTRGLLRSPPLPRGQQLLLLRLPGGGHPDRGRRRRVGDRVLRPGGGRAHRAVRRGAVPRLAGAALQRDHLLPRLRRQRRRIQGHGARALRQAALRGQGAPPDRRRGRRPVPPRPPLLRLPRRQPDVLGEAVPAVRQASARAGVRSLHVRQGRRAQRAGGAGGDPAREGDLPPPPRPQREPLSRGRGGPQLRGRREDRPGGPVPERVRPARVQRRGQRARRGRAVARAPNGPAAGGAPPSPRLPRAGVRGRRDRASARARARPVSRTSAAGKRICCAPPSTVWPPGRW